jgi:hypothetical protein
LSVRDIKAAAEDDTLSLSYTGPLKCLGIYAFDLAENSFVLFSTLATPISLKNCVVARDPKLFVPSRFATLKNSILKLDGTSSDIHLEMIFVGELIRVVCLAQGVKSLHKDDILACIRKLNFEFNPVIVYFLECYRNPLLFPSTVKEEIASRSKLPFHEFAWTLVEQLSAFV